jgi:hypothetical protein
MEAQHEIKKFQNDLIQQTNRPLKKTFAGAAGA